MKLPKKVRVIFGDFPYTTRVEDADTGEIVKGVYSVEATANAGAQRLVIDIDPIDIVLVASPVWKIRAGVLADLIKTIYGEGEQTSAEIASIAGELLHHEDPRVRRVAASALTQAADRE
jgi:hypothetical protein